MLRKKFVYMTGMHASGSDGRRSTPPSSQPDEDSGPPTFNPDTVQENQLPTEQSPQYNRAEAARCVQGMLAAYLRGDRSAFLSYCAQLGGISFEHDVSFADAVLKYFGEFEKGINTFRGSMQGFSTDKGKYKLSDLEYKTLKMAKDLLEAAGYSLDDVPGGEVIQRLLDGYERGEEIEISKEDANKALQFITQMESKILPSSMKQDVLASQLESTNEKQKSYYSTTVPSWYKSSYNE